MTFAPARPSLSISVFYLHLYRYCWWFTSLFQLCYVVVALYRYCWWFTSLFQLCYVVVALYRYCWWFTSLFQLCYVVVALYRYCWWFTSLFQLCYVVAAYTSPTEVLVYTLDQDNYRCIGPTHGLPLYSSCVMLWRPTRVLLKFWSTPWTRITIAVSWWDSLCITFFWRSLPGWWHR